MDVRTTTLDGVLIITPKRFGDARGWFSETYQQSRYRDAGVPVGFVQDNMSLSRDIHTVRGLHFQRPSFVQAKLVQAVRGRLLDVAVDLRPGSPTYGQHVAVELDAESGRQLFIPGGFAHGFCTLEPDTQVLYKCSAPYAPAADGGVLWHDPDLAIDWPVGPDRAVVSDKDRGLPRLTDLGLIDWQDGTR